MSDATTTRRFDPAGVVIAGALALLAGHRSSGTPRKLQITSRLRRRAEDDADRGGDRSRPARRRQSRDGLARRLAAAREAPIRKPILLILGGLAALIALIGLGGGFIPATAILFAATAAAFGRRAFLTDLLIGFVLGVVIFLIFDKLLTLSLPSGPLERLL